MSAQVLQKQAVKSLDAGTKDGFMGEFYTSSLISDMLSQGKYPFRGIAITEDDFVCTGTPAQLIAFQQKLLRDPSPIKKRRICFDLDSTLVTVRICYPSFP